MRTGKLDRERGFQRRKYVTKPLVSLGSITKADLASNLWSAKELRIAARTKVVKISLWEYWRRFCEVWNLYADKFGALGANT